MRNWLRRFLMIAFPLYLAVTSSELAAQLPEEGTAIANRPMAIAVSDQREDPVADSDKSEANTGVNSSSLTEIGRAHV